MKKVFLISIFVASSLFAGWYDRDNSSGDSDSKSRYNESERGYAKAGDKNYENEQVDKHLYGEKNAYQGSRAGDSDWGERNLNHLMEQKK